MPIINDCTLYYAWLTPEYPNKIFNKQNPTWEVQIRTSDKKVKKEWEELKLPIKAIVPDEGDPFFRVNLKKNSMKATDTPLTDEHGNQLFDEKTNKPLYVMEPSEPPEVVDSEMNPIDPSIIGNGSIGNIRIFQYEYPAPSGGKRTGSILMGVQITKLLEYIREKKPLETFEKSDKKTVIIKAEPKEEETATPTPSEY